MTRQGQGQGRAGMPPRLKIYSGAAAERDQARIIMGAISLKRNYGTASVPRFTTPAQPSSLNTGTTLTLPPPPLNTPSRVSKKLFSVRIVYIYLQYRASCGPRISNNCF